MSWDFLGLSISSERRPVVESDTIIGVIDTGIWPELESFNDAGFGPIPATWKGECDGGEDFVCNRKIIGARSYTSNNNTGKPSARDTDGHGTHVSSILAGNEVRHASYYGLAQGTARGGVPSARLAVYKVCDNGCANIDILSAFDQAIADGVHMISISIGSDDPGVFTSDPVAIGAFHAIKKGILTIQPAGNGGPSSSSITSYAPWILTVGATEIDRRIITKLLLGKDTILVGNDINPFPSSASASPLVYGKEATSNCSEIDARNCYGPCLHSSLVDQKIVLCDYAPDKMEVNKPGPLGFIYPAVVNYSMVEPMPTIGLSINDHNLVKTLIKTSTIEPQVQIFRSECINNPRAPFVTSFSSRGPSKFIADIIKPDVVAPGMEILAAFPPKGSSHGANWEKTFSFLTGTSMACPHAAAVAVYVKSFHPEWSPSAIKSALMTTASEMNASLNTEAEFAFGSGLINPTKAVDPGLVYAASFEEYLKIWCNISQTQGSSKPISSSCPAKLSVKDINYPSMAVKVEAGIPFTLSIPRTVTNVGKPNSRYVASIKGNPSNLKFRVKPDTLQFAAKGQKENFALIVRGNNMNPQTVIRVSLVWSDGVHSVRSPIMIYTTAVVAGIAPTPSSPVTTDTTSEGERTQAPSRFHMPLVLLLLITITLYYDPLNYVFIII